MKFLLLLPFLYSCALISGLNNQSLGDILNIQANQATYVNVGGNASACTFSKKDKSWPTSCGQRICSTATTIEGNKTEFNQVNFDAQLERLLQLPVIKLKKEEINSVCKDNKKQNECQVYSIPNASIKFKRADSFINLELPYDNYACTKHGGNKCPQWMAIGVLSPEKEPLYYLVAPYEIWKLHRLDYSTSPPLRTCEW